MHPRQPRSALQLLSWYVLEAFPLRSTPVASPQLQVIAAVVKRIYAAGDVLAAREALAMNVLLDRGVAQRNAEIANFSQTLGNCGAAEPIRSDSAMSATITFPCDRGTPACASRAGADPASVSADPRIYEVVGRMPSSSMNGTSVQSQSARRHEEVAK